MAQTLWEYLDERGATLLDPMFLEEYIRLMKEEVIPEILASQDVQARLQARDRAVADLVFLPLGPPCRMLR